MFFFPLPNSRPVPLASSDIQLEKAHNSSWLSKPPGTPADKTNTLLNHEISTKTVKNKKKVRI